MLLRGDGINKVSHSLCLRQIEASIAEGTHGEFTRVGHSGTTVNQRLQHSLLHIERSMARYLHRGFSCVARGIVDSHDVVQLAEATVGGAAWLQMFYRQMLHHDD